MVRGFYLLLQDPCAGLLATCVVFVIGFKAVQHSPRLRSLGAGVGGMVFLACFWLHLADEGAAVVWTALILGGLMVGSAWIVIPIVMGIIDYPMTMRRLRHEAALARESSARFGYEQARSEERLKRLEIEEEAARRVGQERKLPPPRRQRARQIEMGYREDLDFAEMNPDEITRRAARAEAARIKRVRIARLQREEPDE